MATLWKKSTVVKTGGLIEVVIPTLNPGDVVEVLISSNGSSGSASRASKAGFGYCRGLVELAPDFNAPLDDFKDYM